MRNEKTLLKLGTEHKFCEICLLENFKDNYFCKQKPIKNIKEEHIIEREEYFMVNISMKTVDL